GVLNWFFKYELERISENTGINDILILREYYVYINAIIALILGWFLINSIASLFYTITVSKYGKSTAMAIKNLVRVLGIGGLFVGIAGSSLGGATGVALGGFIGMVVGFASQQVLGQSIAGLFLMLSRPFKIGDKVDIAGESDVIVEEIGTLFTYLRRNDGSLVLVPNSSIIGSKIIIKEKSKD
ncbi:MAG: mechanosensitive ion channel family protein, partial [Candidatus Aenigmatarchaeota archaeon]